MKTFGLSNIRNYYISYNLDQFGAGLVGVFINLFFFSTNNYISVLYFQLATFVIALMTYIPAGYFMRRYHPKYLYLLGLALSVFLLGDLLIATGVLSNVFIFGTIYGASIGILYAGNNVLMYDITKDANRTSFIATNNFLGGAVSLIAPVTAGTLIQFSTFTGMYKFIWDFVIAGVFFVLSAIFILRVKHQGRFRIKYSIRSTIIKARKGYAKFNLYFVTSQIFTMAFGIILPIYVFQTTSSYLITGVFVSYQVLLSVLTNFAFRKGFAEKGLFATYAVPGVIISSLVLLFPSVIVAPINAFIFAGLTTIFLTPLDNAVTVEYMKFLDMNDDINRALFWANREYYLVIGRVAILIPMILIAYLTTNTLNFIFILPLISLYSLVYYKIIKRGKIRLLGFVRGTAEKDF
jgi:MFS family permease